MNEINGRTYIHLANIKYCLTNTSQLWNEVSIYKDQAYKDKDKGL